MAGAMDLTATQLEVNSIAQIILHGRGAMVPVAVSEEQAKSISEYVAGTIKGH